MQKIRQDRTKTCKRGKIKKAFPLGGRWIAAGKTDEGYPYILTN